MTRLKVSYVSERIKEYTIEHIAINGKTLCRKVADKSILRSSRDKRYRLCVECNAKATYIYNILLERFGE